MKVIAVILTGLLFFATFFWSAYNNDLSGRTISIARDNVLVSIIAIIAFAIITYFLTRMLKSKKIVFVFALLVSLVYVFAGLFIVIFGRSIPISDTRVVYNLALSISEGDLSFVQPNGSYISDYPQQIGICTFMSWLIRFFNILPLETEKYRLIFASYSVFAGITVWLLYKTTDEIWNDERVDVIFLVMSLINFPYMMYTNYLYGEMPALLFFAIGTWFTARMFRKKGNDVVNILLLIIAFTMSVFVRKNTLVLIIGVVIALVFEMFRERRWDCLVTAVVLSLCAVFVLPITIKIYEAEADNRISSGVTPLSYIAMGMMDDSTFGAGWYNGFNYDTYEASECDSDEANRIAKEAINERLEIFRSSPAYAFDFYVRKFATQWVEGTYFSREATQNYVGERSAFMTKVYEETYGKYYVLICNILQVIVFFGAFLWSVFSFERKRENKLWQSFVLIGIFGGFLFHMIWEANSRYIITYAVLLIPYAACGYGRLVSMVGELNGKRK